MWATVFLISDKDIALVIEIHDKDNYQAVIDFLNTYNLNIIFRKDYDWADSHVIA